MPLKFQKIHHLIRYALVIAAVSFLLFLFHWFDFITFFFMGPPVYMAFHLKSSFGVKPSFFFDYFFILFPLTLVYYGGSAFLIKTLWNERGKIRLASLAAFIFFLLYIHFQAGSNLLTYFSSPS